MCVNAAFCRWFKRKEDDFDGTFSDIGGLDKSISSMPFSFYNALDTRNYFSTSTATTGSCGLAGTILSQYS